MGVSTKYFGKIDYKTYRGVVELNNLIRTINIKMERLNIPIKATAVLKDLEKYQPSERAFFSKEVSNIIISEQITSKDMQYYIDNNIPSEFYTEEELKIRMEE